MGDFLGDVSSLEKESIIDQHETIQARKDRAM